ncbi:centrosomal protein 43 isoform X2 [Mirounga angustirostris]|uniref:FGFR1 oncogene partner isoform X2 n=1 Tax=Mirounga leonina TaxID=9715 RepID=UPI00156BF882|nr:FGFR1 oncogene partner isoform X2 [Mirounga leonina]XP_034847962.1 FGFR1 oncogene partner isoform X2 [Mirounga leonina]XP_045721839.1 centrosomal protein 43 isoform X2 [Mirounga angustirostris]
MAATAAAVVPEEDTELRDLLVQTLENSGVLNRIKAELRAAVFLALEEQEKVENKTPLVNESLRKFLNTKDGRLVASLVAEFLQFFNLDFTLAVFQPETSTFQGLEGRENLARDLGIIEAEGTVGGPLLLEVIRRCQQKGKGPTNGEGALDLSDVHSPPKSPEGKASAHSGASKKVSNDASQSDTSVSSSEPKSKGGLRLLAHETKTGSFLNNKSLDVKDKAGLCPDEDDMEGDSFFDDPIPKPEKTYGWRNEPSKQAGSLASLSDAPPLKSGLSSLTGAPSLKDSESKRGNTVLKDLKLVNDKIGSLGLGTGEEDDYVDDFNSTSHRSEKSELSIGEEIEEDLSVEIDDLNTSDKLDDLTQDLTVSQLSDIADYLEDVA